MVLKSKSYIYIYLQALIIMRIRQGKPGVFALAFLFVLFVLGIAATWAAPSAAAVIKPDPNALGSLSAAALMSMCFDAAADPSLAGLEHIPPEDTDALALARYIIQEIFLNPTKSSKTTTTTTLPMVQEVLACAPSVAAARGSAQVLSGCRTADDSADIVEYLIKWRAQFTCQNSLEVVHGSEFDMTVGSVLVAGGDDGLAVSKVFIIPETA